MKTTPTTTNAADAIQSAPGYNTMRYNAPALSPRSKRSAVAFERGAGHGADVNPDLIAIFFNGTRQCVMRSDLPSICSRITGASYHFRQDVSLFRMIRGIVRQLPHV
jgi:hypothetical protein